MSRLSVAGTDEAGDTVQVEPEQTNQNTRVCVYTFINYIIYCIDIDETRKEHFSMFFTIKGRQSSWFWGRCQKELCEKGLYHDKNTFL